MNFSTLDSFLESAFGNDSNNPGCDIMIQQDDRTVYRKQFGYSSIQNRTPVNGTEHYRLYSCTKLLTVVGALRLVESKHLSMDAPVSDYIPAFKKAFLLKNGITTSDIPTMTVRHLFTMTAGFDYQMDKPPFVKLFSGNRKVSLHEFADASIQSPLLFAPGERFQYSICHDILGAVVEQVAECSFSEYLYQSVFAPLEMGATKFRSSVANDKKLSSIYRYRKKENDIVCADAEPDPLQGNRFESGGAGVISSVEDYGKFAGALANNGLAKNGYRLLKSETVQLMRSDQLHTITKNAAFSYSCGAGYSYGLGVRTLIDRSQGQKSPFGEFGWDGAAGSYVMIDSDNRLSVFLATHLLNWPARLGIPYATVRDLTYDALNR